MRRMTLTLALTWGACGGDKDDTGPTDVADTDADTDSDTDTDTDTDADADTDTDSDTDADTDAPTGDTGLPTPTGDTAPITDVDRDGHDAVVYGGDDCDDLDEEVHPGAPEHCDGYDEDCDPEVDEDAVDVLTFYADTDQDGHGDASAPVEACNQPPDTASVADDCADGDPATYPSAPAVPCDGADNDCDPLTFEAGRVALNGAPVANLAAALTGATNGATILLCEGRYPESGLVATVGLTMRGVAGSAATVIDAGAASAVLRVTTAQAVTLEGLTLTNGLGAPVGGDRHGGGLWIAPNGNVSADDLVVSGNVSGLGAGAWLGDGATLDLVDARISGNTGDSAYTVVDFGGGIYGEDGVTLNLTRSHVDQNVATACGGVRLGADARVLGDGASTVSYNQERGLGGGGLCAGANVELADLELGNNYAGNTSGGLSLNGGGSLINLIVTTNYAGLGGGGGSLTGDYDVQGSSFLDNSGFDGGGLEVDGGTTLLRGCTFTGNVTSFFSSYGGGAHLSSFGGGTLVSVATDWGPLGANLPLDVSLDTLLWDVAGVQSFTCDAAAGTCQ